MRRRKFITLLAGAAAAWPFAVRAQQPAMPVIGFLNGRTPASDAHLVAAFREALNESGYVEGRNVTIEFRWAEGQLDRLPELAADLVRRKVSVIFAGAIDTQIRAVKAAVATIPTVMGTGGDPVELGLVTSFHRPGGNATAITVISAALWPKRLELLREMASQSTVIAVLINPNNQNAESAMRDIRAAARAIGQKILILSASGERDFDPAFATFANKRADALIVTDDAIFINQREKLVGLAARHSVPAIYGRREFTAAGGLMSYGASTIDQYRQAGLYVGRILKGAKPADLPVLQPTKFDLVINLKTAKALGLTVPDKLIALSSDVIE
jgi:putative tryptophan/tyrosine transport system substrate-binding protein